jgi:hypothetical protein
VLWASWFVGGPLAGDEDTEKGPQVLSLLAFLVQKYKY